MDVSVVVFVELFGQAEGEDEKPDGNRDSNDATLGLRSGYVFGAFFCPVKSRRSVGQV